MKLKVFIADDEKKVCELVARLIDWNRLEMELIGVAYNGSEALDLINETKPDIVISDIQMPGLNGLEVINHLNQSNPSIEFVVISGFRQFEYAKEALKQGVSNYILKPINEQELNHTLEKIKGRILKKRQTNKIEQEERIRLRKRIFPNYILKNKSLPVMDELNQNYGYHFRKGEFFIACLKFDGVFGYKDHFDDKVTWVLKEYLKNCYDYEVYYHENRYVILLNFSDSISASLKRIVQELLQDKHIFTDFSVTMGIGTNFANAHFSLSQRLIEGGNKVIQKKKEVGASNWPNIKSFNKEISSYIELNDIEGLTVYVQKFIEGAKLETGEDVLLLHQQIFNTYVEVLRKFHEEYVPSDLEGFPSQLDNYASAQEMKEELVDKIKQSFKSSIAMREKAETKPITQAKAYIDTHFSAAITLEDVSEVVGYSKSYFSTMFKAITGESFSDYLFNKRMDEAKKMLRDTKLSVAEICESVGYRDLKSFNKNFKKTTGLRPTEYRKIYA